MKTIIAVALDRGRTILLMLALILIMGTVSYVTIPKEAQPDIAIPLVFVNLRHEGISPEDAERMLIRPVEKQLRGLDGVKQISATASEGSANITIEFQAGLDIDKALRDVRDRVDTAKSELPAETDEPTVRELNLALEPVIVVSLSGDIPERQLLRLARDLRDALEAIPQVLEVQIGGDREEVVEIVIPPEYFQTYALNLDQIGQRTRANNVLVAAGNLDSGVGRLPVKVPGLFETPEDILNVPLFVEDDVVIRTREIATVLPTFKDPNSFARLNGQPSLTLFVSKRVGENVIATVDRVRSVVAENQATWPDGVNVAFSQDMSKYIRDMLRDLQNNMLSAVFLVVVICIAALGARSGLLVGIAIPGSFLAGIWLLFLMGLTINIVVLFSLILAVGMLVDGAIVVTEFADRKMTEGLSRREAYLVASQRMATPIIASTATTLAAFMPLLFWPGVVGEFMKFLPITLIATLSASLIMALIFVPTIGAIIGKPGAANPDNMRSLAAAEGGDLNSLTGFTGWYVRRLRKVLNYPLRALAVAILCFVGVQIAYAHFGKGLEFFPQVEPDFANIIVRMRGNLSIHEMDALVREVEAEVLQVQGLRSVSTRTSSYFRGQGITEDTHGLIQLEFDDWNRRRPAKEILSEIERRTSGIAGVILEQQIMEGGPPTGKDIQIELTSYNSALLEEAANFVREHLERTPGLRDVDDSRPVAGVEWQVRVDRAEAARFGADVRTVGNYVQFVTNGLLLGTYRPEGAEDEVDIRVRFPNEFRHIDKIAQLRLATPVGLVSLEQFVQQGPAPKIGRIERMDGYRVVTVSANVDGDVLTDTKVRELKEWQESLVIPDGLRVRFRGEDEEQRMAMDFLTKAFVVALFVMAIILVTQFNSFYHAFLILTAVIFSTVGVFLGLLLTGQPFGVVMNGIGVIALAGIVVNNNIVLIDTFVHHRRAGQPLLEAVLRTGAQRLRPVMLTTITTVLGLLPMVFKLNFDFIGRSVSYGAPSTQWWVQLSTSVVFGLLFSTLLTLVLTPALLMLGGKRIR